MTPVFGGIDIGGTSTRVATSDGASVLADDQVSVIPTTSPSETLAAVVALLDRSGISALGVASFGPLDRRSGVMGATPKLDWQGADLLTPLARALDVPVVVDTDVNGAVIGERALGAAQGCDDAVYVTVSTGIGGGAIVNGDLVHGLGHPEMGHIRIPRPAGDDWPGCCPFHGDCWEGLASGTALDVRYGIRGEDLQDDSVWALEARHLALGLANLVFAYRPQRVVLGGGVLARRGLFDAVRRQVVELVDARYLPEVGRIEELIVAPALGANAGVHGALCFARASYED